MCVPECEYVFVMLPAECSVAVSGERSCLPINKNRRKAYTVHRTQHRHTVSVLVLSLATIADDGTHIKLQLGSVCNRVSYGIVSRTVLFSGRDKIFSVRMKHILNERRRRRKKQPIKFVVGASVLVAHTHFCFFFLLIS